jgi:hypothetical protein
LAKFVTPGDDVAMSREGVERVVEDFDEVWNFLSPMVLVDDALRRWVGDESIGNGTTRRAQRGRGDAENGASLYRISFLPKLPGGDQLWDLNLCLGEF